MYRESPIFAQIMGFVPWRKFQKIIRIHGGDYHVKTLKTAVLFRVLAFAQLAQKRSLRDTVFSLNLMKTKLWHMGIRGAISLNNLSHAMAQRDWKIFADLGYLLIDEAQNLYKNDSYDLDLKNPVFALDSTTIDLCLSLFTWADFRSKKAGIKVHTLLDTKSAIPVFIRISAAQMHDVNILDELKIIPGAWYVMDRGYMDFERLFQIHTTGAKFVTRAKSNIKLKRMYSRKVDKASGFRCDQTVRLTGQRSSKFYPEKLRIIKFFDEEKNKKLIFLTNDFDQSSETIATLYKRRWQVELFFKWIKQNLHVKKFFGQTENAVRIQIWVAICTYLLVAIMRRVLKSNVQLSQLLHFFKNVPFEEMSINKALAENFCENELQNYSEQPFLPGFLMGH